MHAIALALKAFDGVGGRCVPDGGGCGGAPSPPSWQVQPSQWPAPLAVVIVLVNFMPLTVQPGLRVCLSAD